MSEKVSPLRQPAAPVSAAAFMHEVAGLIVEALNLDVAPADIDPAQPLYGEGLGLDSIDILEIALAVSKRYGVQLRAVAFGHRERDLQDVDRSEEHTSELQSP